MLGLDFAEKVFDNLLATKIDGCYNKQRLQDKFVNR